MIGQQIDYTSAVSNIPIGTTLFWPNFTWKEFESLAAQLGDRRDVRLSYDRGEMEIAMPSPEHEEYVDLIQDLTRTLVRTLGMRLESRGTALLKRALQETGAQPDGCFYIQHAQQIIGKRALDLNVDPPPDVVVEVDLSSRSQSKFSIYATLGVPEIWLYNGKRFSIYHFDGSGYVAANQSLAFPLLTVEVMTEMLTQSKQVGQDETLTTFQQWIGTQRRS